jgi:hypothetical protein
LRRRRVSNFFEVYEKDSDTVLAKLPLTIPIGATIEGYEKAGINVGWRWPNE